MGENLIMKPKGTTLYIEKPFAYCLDNKYVKERCDNCLHDRLEGKPRKCTGCEYAHYCDEKCQKEAWKNYHKYECKIIKNKLHRFPKPVIPSSVLIIMRIMNKLKRGGREERVYYTDKDSRTFDDLMTHEKEVLNSSIKMDFFESIMHVLEAFLGKVNFVEVFEIYCKLVVNSFHILDPEVLSVAIGLYLGCSTMDHSCDPNCMYIFHGPTIEIRNVKDIPDYTWDKVRTCYIEPLNTREERRRLLNEGYFFHCECERCLNEDEYKLMNSMQCPNRTCNAAVYVKIKSVEEVSCNRCNTKIPSNIVKKYQEIVELTEHHLKEMENKEIKYIDACELCLRKQEGLFHPMNVRVVKLLDNAFDAAIDLKLWEKADEYGRSFLIGAQKYYGENHYLLGKIYLKLLKLSFVLEKLDESFALYDKCLKNLEISVGEKHRLYGILKEIFRDNLSG